MGRPRVIHVNTKDLKASEFVTKTARAFRKAFIKGGAYSEAPY